MRGLGSKFFWVATLSLVERVRRKMRGLGPLSAWKSLPRGSYRRCWSGSMRVGAETHLVPGQSFVVAVGAETHLVPAIISSTFLNI